MAEQEDTPIPEIKVTRKRKRLYEPLSEETLVPEPASKSGETGSKPLVYEKSKVGDADAIVMDYVAWSAGVVLIPLPFIDVIVGTVLRLKMVEKLSDLYEIPFSKNRGKALIAALIGGLQTRLLTGSLVKIIPGVGISGAIVIMGTMSGAMTYAVGKVFVQHFETGGTLLDFDPAKVKAYFAEKYREGQEVASELKKSSGK
jgi:uncharacterized protein (DUF697 family)